MVVLGGGMSNVDRLYRTVPQRVKDWVFGGECETPIRKAVHGDSSGGTRRSLVMAATAALALQQSARLLAL